MTYKQENRALLSNYDSWLQSLVGQRSGMAFGLGPVSRGAPCGFPGPTAFVD